MSKVRNISGGPLDVPLLNRVVEADEVVEVPDYQPAHSADDPLPVVWPPNRWEYQELPDPGHPVNPVAAPHRVADTPATDEAAE